MTSLLSVQVTDSTGDESSSYGRFNDDLTEALRAASDHWVSCCTSACYTSGSTFSFL